MKSKAQVQSIIIFFAVLIGVFIVAILVSKSVNVILTPFANSLGNVSTTAGAAVTNVQTGFNKMWDTAVMLLFLLNVIILLVSAFLIDVHPAFVILYIFAILFLVVFGSSAESAMDHLYNMGNYGLSDQFSNEVAKMPMTKFVVDNFNFIILGIIVLSGIVTYAKFKFSSNIGGAY